MTKVTVKKMDKPANPISFWELSTLLHEGKLKEHHTALIRGYVSRKRPVEDITATPYKGRYGAGYIVDYPNYNSTRYSLRTYYIFESEV